MKRRCVFAALPALAWTICAWADAAGIRVIGQLVIDGVPPIPEHVTSRLSAYQHSRSAQLFGWVGDGLLIGTRLGNATQLHRVAAPLGMRRQLTFFREPVAGAQPRPTANPTAFVYQKDVGGGEFYQLFRFDLATGASTLLSDGQSRHSGVIWADDGGRFAYTTTERNGVDWDIHVQDLAGNVSTALAERGVGWQVADWSPDGQRLLALQYKSINESHLHEVALGEGTVTPLLEDFAPIAIDDARYDRSGSRVYFTSDLGGEFTGLHRLDLNAASAPVALTPDTPWDVEGLALSRAGGKLAFSINEGGVSRPLVFATPSAASGTPASPPQRGAAGPRQGAAVGNERADELVEVPLPELPPGIVHSLTFNHGGDALAFVVNHATSPADAYSVRFDDGALTRWTQSELGGLRRSALVAPERISYRTFDDLDIPAFLYLPPGPGPHPVLIDIHGGPEGQYRPRFSPATQHLVAELGIAVIAPNVRGSAGYGKSWLKLDNGYRREDSVKDIGALLDWIAASGKGTSGATLDARRVAVSGGSYGGYMVLAAMMHYGDRLRAGVERVGISNFVTFLENTQGYRQDLRRAEYGDERNPKMREFLQSVSPLNHVERITKPLLIAQGLNDPRVPASESEQIVAALKAQGVPVWYVLARDEGHGFRKKANRDYLAAATALFLQEHLLAGR